MKVVKKKGGKEHRRFLQIKNIPFPLPSARPFNHYNKSYSSRQWITILFISAPWPRRLHTAAPRGRKRRKCLYNREIYIQRRTLALREPALLPRPSHTVTAREPRRRAHRNTLVLQTAGGGKVTCMTQGLGVYRPRTPSRPRGNVLWVPERWIKRLRWVLLN